MQKTTQNLRSLRRPNRPTTANVTDPANSRVVFFVRYHTRDANKTLASIINRHTGLTIATTANLTLAHDITALMNAATAR